MHCAQCTGTIARGSNQWGMKLSTKEFKLRFIDFFTLSLFLSRSCVQCSVQIYRFRLSECLTQINYCLRCLRAGVACTADAFILQIEISISISISAINYNFRDLISTRDSHTTTLYARCNVIKSTAWPAGSLTRMFLLENRRF